MKIKSAEFRTFASVPTGMVLPEYVFAGRSNAGKSTILNVLTGRKINRVSRTPGCTRNLNFITINGDFNLVDIPGYGFAKTGGSEKKRFLELTEKYFIESKNIRIVFIIMDIGTAPTSLDISLLEWLQSIGKNFVIILNKADKIPKNRLLQKVTEIKKKLGFDYPMIPVSALKKENIMRIWDYFV